jgi:hypothetical protein
LYGLPRHGGFAANAVLTSNYCVALIPPLLYTLSIANPAVLPGSLHAKMLSKSCQDDTVHRNGFSTSKNTFVTCKFHFNVTPSTDDHHNASCRGATYAIFAITQVILPYIALFSALTIFAIGNCGKIKYT